MRAILLCAGRGSRLNPLTSDRPKCLVKVGGKVILDHQIDALLAAGIGEIVVVGGYRFDQLAAHVAVSERRDAIRLIGNAHWATTSSIGSVQAAHDLLDGPFCILNGDTVFEPDLIVAALAGARQGVNLVVEHAPPEPDDMRVALAGDRLLAVGKGLARDIAHARSIGIVICPDADGGPYRAMLDGVLAQPGGAQHYHHDVIDRIARAVPVHAVLLNGYGWQEIDRIDDIRAWERRTLRDAA